MEVEYREAAFGPSRENHQSSTRSAQGPERFCVFDDASRGRTDVLASGSSSPTMSARPSLVSNRPGCSPERRWRAPRVDAQPCGPESCKELSEMGKMDAAVREGAQIEDP